MEIFPDALRLSGLRLCGLAQQRTVPTRTRCETVAVLRLQGLEPCQQDIGAGVADVLDRAAAERGETGTEDHPGIQQFGVGDHAVVQAGHGFVEHGQQQAISRSSGTL